MEFAAGVMSRALPALELFTTAFSKFDAAGFGQRLADAFIGGREAMNGFSKALEALKVGNLSLAFEIAFKSISIQLQNTANEIWKRLSASFSAAVDFIKIIMGPGSSIWQIVGLQFDSIGLKLELSIKKALASVADALGVLGIEISKDLEMSMLATSSAINKNAYLIGVAAGNIGEDLKKAGKQFPESFDRAYRETKPLFNVEKDVASLNVSLAELEKKKLIGDEAKKNAEELSGTLKDMSDSLAPLPSIFTENAGAAGQFAGAMTNLGNSINGVPNDKNIKINVEGVDSFEQKLKKLTADINGVPDSKTVQMALDTGGFNNLQELKKELEFFPDSKRIKMILEKSGLSLEEFKEKINGIPESKRTELAIEATGIENAERARAVLNAMQNKRVQAAVEATGTEGLQGLLDMLNGIPPRKASELAMEVTGTDSVEDAADKLESFPGSTKKKMLLEAFGVDSLDKVQEILRGIPNEKQVKAALKASGLKDAEDLKRAIDLLLSKNINIGADTQPAQNAIKGVEAQIDAISNNIVTLNFTDNNALSQIASSVPGYFQEPINLDMTADGSLNEIAGSLSSYFTNPISLDMSAEGDLSEISSSLPSYFSGEQTLNLTAESSLSAIESGVSQLGSEPVELKLNASSGIENIRNELSKEIDLSLSSSEGSKILTKINIAVDAIKEAVVSLNKKLPQPALGS
jgi:hypothetical protein